MEYFLLQESSSGKITVTKFETYEKAYKAYEELRDKEIKSKRSNYGFTIIKGIISKDDNFFIKLT